MIFNNRRPTMSRLIFNENRPDYTEIGITVREVAEMYAAARNDGGEVSLDWLGHTTALDEKNGAIREFEEVMEALEEAVKSTTDWDVFRMAAGAVQSAGYALAYAYQSAALEEGMKAGARLLCELTGLKA
jgi:hypothetical protein